MRFKNATRNRIFHRWELHVKLLSEYSNGLQIILIWDSLSRLNQDGATHVYTAISIKVVHEQSGKVEYERERLLGIANKLMNFQSGSQQPFALVFDFSALLVDNLN
jgi:hypothetical protein